MSDRMNVTLQLHPHIARLLQQIAQQEARPIDDLVRDFVLQALEEREDLALSEQAQERESEAKDVINHDDAWK